MSEIKLPRSSKETLLFLQEKVKETTDTSAFKMVLQIKNNGTVLEVPMITERPDISQLWLITTDDEERAFYIMLPEHARGYYKASCPLKFNKLFTLLTKNLALNFVKVLECQPIFRTSKYEMYDLSN